MKVMRNLDTCCPTVEGVKTSSILWEPKGGTQPAVVVPPTLKAGGRSDSSCCVTEGLTRVLDSGPTSLGSVSRIDI